MREATGKPLLFHCENLIAGSVLNPVCQVRRNPFTGGDAPLIAHEGLSAKTRHAHFDGCFVTWV